MTNNLEKKLMNVQTKKLGERESEAVWSKIRTEYAAKSTPASLLHAKHISIIQKALALGLIFGLTGVTTAFASDGARPGDILFPVDQAVESVRLSLSSGEKQDQLRMEFASERMREIDEIIASVSSSADMAMAEDVDSASERNEKVSSSSEDGEDDVRGERKNGRVAEGEKKSGVALSDSDRERVQQGLNEALQLLRGISGDSEEITEKLHGAVNNLNTHAEGVSGVSFEEKKESVKGKDRVEVDADDRSKTRVRVKEKRDLREDRVLQKIENEENDRDDKSDEIRTDNSATSSPRNESVDDVEEENTNENGADHEDR